jgi:hypothetical protein
MGYYAGGRLDAARRIGRMLTYILPRVCIAMALDVNTAGALFNGA